MKKKRRKNRELRKKIEKWIYYKNKSINSIFFDLDN